MKEKKKEKKKVTWVQQYKIGKKPTGIWTLIYNRHAGTPIQRQKHTMKKLYTRYNSVSYYVILRLELGPSIIIGESESIVEYNRRIYM